MIASRVRPATPSHTIAPAAHRQRRDERLRLREQDRRSERLASLHAVTQVLVGARNHVAAGWVQHRWFAPSLIVAAAGGTGGSDGTEAVVGGCLVGSLVLAGGGVRAASGQPVQRAIALTWHTLFRAAEPEVDWCAPSAVRLARARDLVRWNDLPSRCGDDVVALLERALRGALDRTAVERAAAGVQPIHADRRS